jgi:CheY-specific phosphatase CheX
VVKLSEKMLAAVAKDWQEMIGIELQIERDGSAIPGGTAELAGKLGGTCLAVETQITGDLQGPVHIVFSRPLVARVVGAMVMLPEGAIEEKEKNGLEDSDLEAFQEMANLLCGSCNNLFQELGRNVRVSQAVEDLQVHEGELTKEGMLPEGELVGVPVTFRNEGREFSGMQVFTAKLAERIPKKVPVK